MDLDGILGNPRGCPKRAKMKFLKLRGGESENLQKNFHSHDTPEEVDGGASEEGLDHFLAYKRPYQLQSWLKFWPKWLKF